MVVKLYPHQQKAVNDLHNGAILRGEVGTGKSLTAVAYYIQKEAPRDVYVITTAKKRDSVEWEGEFAKYGVGKSKDSTLYGCLTVDSWNNIGKYVGVKHALFIFDEQRLVGSGKWTDSFVKIAKHNRWILLSATPGDTWLDYIPVFVANGFYRNRSEFKREHVVYSPYSKFPKVQRYTGLERLVRLQKLVLVEMPYPKHTIRECQTIQVGYDVELFNKVVRRKWNVYKEKPLRGVAELFSVMRKVVNSSPSRVESLANLTRKHPKLIVYYNFDYELDLLRSFANSLMNGTDSTWLTLSPVYTTSSSPTSEKDSRSSSSASVAKQTYQIPRPELERTTSTIETPSCGSTFQVAEWNGHKHEKVPETDRWLYLVQYSAGAEGWNCTTTDAMVFYSLPYSYKLWHQAHGRIDRLNTPFTKLFYYYLRSDSAIDQAIGKCLDEKRNFNESSYNGGK